jgi:hypothetical protein
MCATEQHAMFVFGTMTENPAATVIASGRQGVYCALKAVERMRIAGEGDLKRLVVFVSAHFTCCKGFAHISSF